MRFRSALLVLIATLSACGYGPTQFNPHRPQYVRCRSTICVIGDQFRPTRIGLPFVMDDEVGRQVRVPLQDVQAPDFRLLGDGWATDGRHVWCGQPKPEGTFAEFRVHTEGYYAIGTSIRYQCEPLQKKWIPVQAESVELLGCNLFRLDGRLHFLQRGQAIAVEGADDATFVLDDVKLCRGRDRFSRFQVEGSQLRVLPPAL